MKWLANVTVLGDEVPGGRRFAIWPIPADYEMEAAMSAANNVATELFGVDGRTGFINSQGDQTYMATIGVYQGFGLTRGRSLSILVQEYRGGQ